MARRESFLLRIDPAVLEAVRKWAEDDLRSVNGQLEWILRGALKAAGRNPKSKSTNPSSTTQSSSDQPVDDLGPTSADEA